MGLDMYLIKRKTDCPDDVTVIGYWRKANQIHRWFVTNVQNGVDDQGEYLVTKEQAQTLRDVCAEAAKCFTSSGKRTKQGGKDRLKRLLPTQDGFFFGSTEYDEWYLAALKNTIMILDDVLSGASIDWNTERLFYTVWW